MTSRFPFPSKAESRARRRETRRTRDDAASLASRSAQRLTRRIALRSDIVFRRRRVRVRGEHGRHRYALARGHRTDALVIPDGHGK
jgi:hypothetical protein